VGSLGRCGDHDAHPVLATLTDTSSFSFGAWFAVVTVDPDLGLVRVELSGMIFIIKLLYRA
jgi:CO/xanthine dehydrogenase Mo-binding subunit